VGVGEIRRQPRAAAPTGMAWRSGTLGGDGAETDGRPGGWTWNSTAASAAGWRWCCRPWRLLLRARADRHACVGSGSGFGRSRACCCCCCCCVRSGCVTTHEGWMRADRTPAPRRWCGVVWCAVCCGVRASRRQPSCA
jgi:hypothetical protein